MRFAILVKATQASEAGVLPGEETLREVVEYHEELQRAGVLYDAMGLRPTREGWRIGYSGATRSVVEGPFVEGKDQIAGFTIIQVRSREEAMGWAMRFPWPTHDMNVDGEIEVRQVFELEDFVQGPAIARFRQLGPLDRIATDVARARPDLTSATAPNGTATILFTDIEGSTQLTERLGDREWMSLLREHNEIVRAQATMHSGFEVKSQGDGFMLAFASAHNAVRCAIGIQQALAERDPGAQELRVRIGLHTGEPVREADDFYGKSVNLAARIAAEARGSEILVSALVHALVESSGEFSFEDPTDAELKGLSGMYRLSAVRWRKHPGISSQLPPPNRCLKRAGRPLPGPAAIRRLGADLGVCSVMVSRSSRSRRWSCWGRCWVLNTPETLPWSTIEPMRRPSANTS